MTNEEAIEKLREISNDYWDDDGYGGVTRSYTDGITAIDMAIEALRKQKTAKRINISGTDCQCSHCMSWNDLMDKYCWQCGAKMGGRQCR